ncbi:MAG TPA: hypothetical protein EYH30_11490 [Anaerolineales bacterium]|nr:hypothetical protein [Anaerolineae bacterium]HIQ02718.1 hypothetical protein [Anaerolineales bacterium]
MGQRQVLVEMRVPRSASVWRVRELAGQLTDYGFDWDPDYLVPLENPAGEARRGNEEYRFILLRGRIEEGREPELEARSDVIRIWSDAPIAPFVPAAEEAEAEKADRPRKSPFAF